jgi:hypothetical protein
MHGPATSLIVLRLKLRAAPTGDHAGFNVGSEELDRL